MIVPATLDAGTYDVTVTRKAQDVYLVDGTKTYVRTEFCYEYAYGQGASLVNNGVGAYMQGKLKFR